MNQELTQDVHILVERISSVPGSCSQRSILRHAVIVLACKVVSTDFLSQVTAQKKFINQSLRLAHLFLMTELNSHFSISSAGRLKGRYK